MQSKRRSYTHLFCFHFGNAVLLLLLFFIPLLQNSQAAITLWEPNSSGHADSFDWLNGGSDKSLFGSPVLVDGDTLHFEPPNFIAESILGKSAIKSDRLQVDILAHSDIIILGVEITESGDYNVNNEGKVSASAALFLTNLSHYEVRSATFDMEPEMPVIVPPAPQTGDWDGEISIENLDWTHFRIVLNNNLIATSRPMSNSFIKKTQFDIRIITIPEPATVAILTLGGFAIPLRSRKKYRQRNLQL